MLDWLKEILGEGYTEEIDKKVSEEIGKSFVSRSDFNSKNETVKDLTQRLTEANAKIEEFKGMDIDGIKKEADNWKVKAEQAQKDADARIAEMEHDSLLRERLSGVNFSSDYARKGVFDEIKAKGLAVENGSILGFDEALNAIREAQPAAFEPDKPAPQFSTGVTPPGASSGMKFNFTGVREKPKD